MIYIRVKEILKEKNAVNIGLLKKWNGGYQALSHLMNNETSGIHFDTLEKMCEILDCEPGDIIVRKKTNRKKVNTNEQVTKAI